MPNRKERDSRLVDFITTALDEKKYKNLIWCDKDARIFQFDAIRKRAKEWKPYHEQIFIDYCSEGRRKLDIKDARHNWNSAIKGSKFIILKENKMNRLQKYQIGEVAFKASYERKRKKALLNDHGTQYSNNSLSSTDEESQIYETPENSPGQNLETATGSTDMDTSEGTATPNVAIDIPSLANNPYFTSTLLIVPPTQVPVIVMIPPLQEYCLTPATTPEPSPSTSTDVERNSSIPDMSNESSDESSLPVEENHMPDNFFVHDDQIECQLEQVEIASGGFETSVTREENLLMEPANAFDQVEVASSSFVETSVTREDHLFMGPANAFNQVPPANNGSNADNNEGEWQEILDFSLFNTNIESIPPEEILESNNGEDTLMKYLDVL